MGAERSLVVGATILAASFIPVAVIPNGQRFGVAVAVMALVLSASLLAVASAALFPFEMRAVVALSGDRLVATHYGSTAPSWASESSSEIWRSDRS